MTAGPKDLKARIYLYFIISLKWNPPRRVHASTSVGNCPEMAREKREPNADLITH
jgi:hypothetical protein